jgi:ABC-2 type transport system permease protein
MIYALMGAWLVILVPRLFHFPQLATWQPLLWLMLPYTLACIFFGMVVSCIVRYRENVMLLMVFVSVPLLFMTGVSWPLSNISGFWQGVSWVFPSTFGVKAYVRLNSMGACVGDVSIEIMVLWLHTFLYFWLACVVYGYQIYVTRYDAFWRYREMKARKSVLARNK